MNTARDVTATPDPAPAPPNVVRGMIIMALAMILLPMMDAIAKILAVDYDVTATQTAFGRFFVQALLLAPIIVAVLGPRALLPRNAALNLLRGVLMGLAVMIFFATLRYMPLADALAVFFLEPFILTMLSVVFLRETIGWRRWCAVFAGFIGAMLIVQPSYAVFGAISLMPVATAFLFAVYLLLTRRLGGDDHPFTMQFAAGVGGALFLFVVLMLSGAFGWGVFARAEIPDPGIRWLLIFAIGCLATLGHLMVVIAFRAVSASILAPFQYLEIVTATLLGYTLFNEFPDALKWLGIGIIVASGIYLFTRERRVALIGGQP